MILYLIYGFGMVTCTVSPLSRFTAHLLPVYSATLIFHVCRNENFRNSYLSFYWKKWFYIWYMALAWWLVPCLPFPDLPHIYFLFTVQLTNERVGVFLARRSVQHLVEIGRNVDIYFEWLCPFPVQDGLLDSLIMFINRSSTMLDVWFPHNARNIK